MRGAGQAADRDHHPGAPHGPGKIRGILPLSRIALWVWTGFCVPYRVILSPAQIPDLRTTRYPLLPLQAEAV
jgi:hypothetical protein